MSIKSKIPAKVSLFGAAAVNERRTQSFEDGFHDSSTSHIADVARLRHDHDQRDERLLPITSRWAEPQTPLPKVAL